MNTNELKKVKTLGIFFLGYTVIFLGFFATLKFTLPFVIAGLTTYLLKKPTRYLINRFNLNKSVATILSILLFYIVIGGLITLIIIGFISEVSNVILMFNTDFIMAYIDKISKELLWFYNSLDPKITEYVSVITSSLSSWVLTFSKGFLNNIMGMAKNVPYLFTAIGFAIISTYFMLKNTIESKYSNLSIKNTKYYDLAITTLRMIFKYAISFASVILLSFIQLLILLLICRVPNALLISIISALLDVLPIVGMALIIIPLGLYYIVTGAYVKGIIILIGYVAICLIRQVIEPKIMSTALNISPLESLVAIFVGLNLAGIVGIIYCTFLIVCFNIFKNKYNIS